MGILQIGTLRPSARITLVQDEIDGDSAQRRLLLAEAVLKRSGAAVNDHIRPKA